MIPIHMGPSNEERIKSAETLFSILRTLYQLDGGGITELANELQLSKSTVYRHLATLRDLGYVIQEDDVYHLSLEFLKWGRHVQTRREEYVEARSVVEELASETDERAQFLVEERGMMVCIHRITGDRAVIADSGEGKHLPMHATASGKAVLSALPEDEARELVRRQSGTPLKRYTEHTITDIDELIVHLDQVREQGYSLNDEEYISGLRGIGVPVTHSEQGVIGALTISAPTNRLKNKDLEEQVTILLGATNELELNIEY